MEYIDRELKEQLEELYWDENKSLSQISKELGISYATLHKMFVKLKVPRRTIKKSTKLYWKTHERFPSRDELGRYTDK